MADTGELFKLCCVWGGYKKTSADLCPVGQHLLANFVVYNTG